MTMTTKNTSKKHNEDVDDDNNKDAGVSRV